MPDFQEGRYFTPPQPVPLNLDLMELRGGGDVTSEFWGKTLDGREVYARYRGGWLTVTVANQPDIDALDDGKNVLHVGLGPPFHGTMSTGQLCHYAGITIKGKKPELPTTSELARHGLKDLSGSVTFFSIELVRSTKSTALDLLQAFINQDGIGIVQGLYNDDRTLIGAEFCSDASQIKSCNPLIIVGAAPAADELMQLKNQTFLAEEVSGRAILTVTYSGLQFAVRARPNTTKRGSEELNSRIVVAGETEATAQTDLSIRGSFQTHDAATRNLFTQVEQIFDQAFPRKRLLAYDLFSGKRMPDHDEEQNLDPTIVDWVLGSSDRWWHIVKRSNLHPQDYYGLRPEP